MSDPFFNYFTVDKADNLIAYYRLGEASGTICADSGVLGYPLTYAGSPSFSQTGLVKNTTNSGIAFPTSSDYANSSTTIGTADTNWNVQEFTAIACVYGDPSAYTAPNGGYMDIFQRSAGSYNSWAINVRTDGYVEFGITDTALAYHGLVSTNPITDNERTLILATFHVDADTGEAFQTLHVNGERTVSAALTGAAASVGYGSADNVTVGTRTASGWVGTIDECLFLDTRLTDNDAYIAKQHFDGQITTDIDIQWSLALEIDFDVLWSYQVLYDFDALWHYTVEYDIDALWTAAFHTDFDVKWTALTDTSYDIDLRWQARDAVTYDTDLSWAAFVTYDTVIRWAGEREVTHDTDLSWKGLTDVAAFVTYDLDLPWNTSAVTYDTDLTWGHTFTTTVTYDTDIRWQGTAADVITYDMDIPWQTDTGTYQSLPATSFHITLNGRQIEITNAVIDSREGSPYLQAQIDLANAADLYKFQLGAAFTLNFFGTEYALKVSTVGTSEGRPSINQIAQAPKITGLSPVYDYSDAVSEGVTVEYRNNIDARTALELILEQSVTWDCMTWTIPKYRLSASDVAPLDIAKTIPEAIGAFIQSNPDGTLLVRSQFPVAVHQLDITAFVTLTVRAERDAYTTTRTATRRKFFDVVIVANGDPDATRDTMEWVYDADSKLRGTMRIYPDPYRTSVRLTTDKRGVSIGTLREIVRDELEEGLEVINGQVTLRYPPSNIQGITWCDTALGAFSIQGRTLTASVAGNTLINIRYQTRHLVADASSSEERKALFILQEN